MINEERTFGIYERTSERYKIFCLIRLIDNIIKSRSTIIVESLKSLKLSLSLIKLAFDSFKAASFLDVRDMNVLNVTKQISTIIEVNRVSSENQNYKTTLNS